MLCPASLGSSPRSLIACSSPPPHTHTHPAAAALAQLRNPEGARQAWLQLIEVEAANGHACHALGALEQQQGELDAAMRWFERGCSCKGARGVGDRAVQVRLLLLVCVCLSAPLETHLHAFTRLSMLAHLLLLLLLVVVVLLLPPPCRRQGRPAVLRGPGGAARLSGEGEQVGGGWVWQRLRAWMFASGMRSL